MRVTIPLRTVNESNNRDHWATRARRTKKARAATFLALRAASGVPIRPAVGLVVTLTRIAPSAGVDDDGLRSALKAVRDGVADWLGVDDGPRGPVRWEYAQRRGRPGEYAVEIAFAAAEGRAA